MCLKANKIDLMQQKSVTSFLKIRNNRLLITLTQKTLVRVLTFGPTLNKKVVI